MRVDSLKEKVNDVSTGRLWSSTSGHQYEVYIFMHFKKVY